jgi:antitoxin ParD1/3/4
MASTKAISVELGAKQRAILRRQLESGRYENASEVLGDALRLMESREAIWDEWLRGEVAASIGDKRRPVAMDEVFSRIEARHARRLKAAKRGK